jgi:hypothetical protein
MDVLSSNTEAASINVTTPSKSSSRNPDPIADTVRLLTAILRAEAPEFVDRAVDGFESAVRAICPGIVCGNSRIRTLDAFGSSYLVQLADDWWNGLGSPVLAHFHRFDHGRTCVCIEDRLTSAKRAAALRMRCVPPIRMSWLRPVALATAKRSFRGEAERMVYQLAEIVASYLEEQSIARASNTASREQPRALSESSVSAATSNALLAGTA